MIERWAKARLSLKPKSLNMSKLIIKMNANVPELGTWGEWKYGNESGIFGRSLKGMWAQMFGGYFLGLETYEQSVNANFRRKLIGWREMNAQFRRMNEMMAL